MPYNHLTLCCPLLSLPSIFPNIKVFSSEPSVRIKWPKSWSFSFSISPSNEYSGLISFGIDWFDLLANQGTLKSLPQHHNFKASVLPHSTFLMIQLSHPYMTIGKTIALIIWTFVGKVMSLLFNMLSMFVIAFLPRSKHLLIDVQNTLKSGPCLPHQPHFPSFFLCFLNCSQSVLGIFAWKLIPSSHSWLLINHVSTQVPCPLPYL